MVEEKELNISEQEQAEARIRFMNEFFGNMLSTYEKDRKEEEKMKKRLQKKKDKNIIP